MAGDKKISQLTAATSVGITDVLPIVQSSQTKKITWNNAMLSITKVGTVTTGVWNGTAIAIAYGGTNSTAALSNDRLMVSSGGAIVEHFANTQNNVAYYNGSGLPTGSTIFQFNGTNLAVGLSVASATSKLHVKSSTGTGTNKVFLAESGGAGAVADAFYVTEAGTVSSKLGYWLNGAKFLHYGSALVSACVFLGENSGNATQTGTSVFGLGYGAGSSLTTGSDHILIGYRAGTAITTGNNCTIIGSDAGNGTSASLSNATIIGFHAARGCQAAGTFIGYLVADSNNISGIQNLAIGSQAGDRIRAGAYNTYIGEYAGQSTSTPLDLEGCIAIGNDTRPTKSHQAIIGGNYNFGHITEVVFGANAAATTDSTLLLKSTDGSGTDKNGWGLTIASGISTGTGSCDLKFQTTTSGSTGSSPNALADRFVITGTDGRIYGTAIHNNTGSLTGTTNQYIASGTYTPTLTNVANVAASTAYQCQWIRVGNVVTVSGKVDLDPTLTATSTQLGISLPIASNLGAAEDCAGTAFCDSIAGQGAAILGDATNNRAQLTYLSGDINNNSFYFSFTYEVL